MANLTKLKAQREGYRQILLDVLEGNIEIEIGEYRGKHGSHSKLNKCIHGSYLYEECSSCVDNHILKKMTEIDNIP